MTEKELKEEFIKYFGEELWEEEEILVFLQNVLFEVCNDYLGVIHPVPVLFEDLEGNDSILDLENECIFLNRKNKGNKTLLMACVIHEATHLFQIAYAATENTLKARRWREELKHYIDDSNPVGNVLQEIEIDAEATAQIVLSCEYGLTYKHPDDTIQALIEEYILSRKILEP